MFIRLGMSNRYKKYEIFCCILDRKLGFSANVFFFK